MFGNKAILPVQRFQAGLDDFAHLAANGGSHRFLLQHDDKSPENVDRKADGPRYRHSTLEDRHTRQIPARGIAGISAKLRFVGSATPSTTLSVVL